MVIIMKSKFLIKPKVFLHYIYIYILIIFQGSIFFKNYQDLFYIGTFLFFGIYILLKRKKIDKRYFTGLFILTVLLFFTSLITGGSLGVPSILNILSRYLLIYIIYDYNKDQFCNRYVLLVSWLSGISLVLFFVQIINIDYIKNIFPVIINSGHRYYGQFIYTLAPDHTNKNVGLFAEPGLYQIVLCAALYILLFMNQKLTLGRNKKIACFITLSIAVISAQSTTGYISVIILVMFYLLKKETDRIYLKWIVIGITVFLIFDVQKGELGLIYQNFINKLFSESGEFDVTVSTGAARYYSMLADIRVANKYPFGVGFDNYSNLWRSFLLHPIADKASCVGITYSLATVGYISTFYTLGFYLWLINRNFSDIYMKMAYIILFLNISLAQPGIRFPALMILTLIHCEKDNSKRRLT